MKSPREMVREAVGDAPSTPLLVLFLLNVVDELDQVTFGVVAPNIRDTFGVSEATVVAVGALSAALVIMLVLPIGYQADRRNRVAMVSLAAMAWGSMTVLTGVAGFIGIFALFVLARFGAGLGRVMNEPVHVSLLADYYPPVQHGRVYSIHRAANAVGGGLVLVCALLADTFGWRLAFVVLSAPTFIAWRLLHRLDEPARGASLDQALATRAEERADKVSFLDAWRHLKAVPSLRRSWIAGFFLGGSIIPASIFLSFFFENEYGVESITARGAIATLYAAGSIAGLRIGSVYSTKALSAGDLPRLATYGSVALVASALGFVGIALAPWLAVSVAFVFVLGTAMCVNSFALPVLAATSPPRLRSQALGYFAFFIGMGALLVGPAVAVIGGASSYRTAIALLSLVLVAGGLVYGSIRQYVRRDADEAYAAFMLDAGLGGADADSTPPLVMCRGIEVAYDQVQVLFGVDIQVNAGECVALLGTNGAGKSTLLRAISGTVGCRSGTVLFDGKDITHASGVARAKAGIVQIPGGKAIFPTLTVAEHLRAAGWLYRKDPEHLTTATADVLDTFPVLRNRMSQLAGDLSGGEQQMLALGMAFIARPRLLMIDELSLGLAPAIVEQLLGIVRRIQDSGTAVILVEQSINVAFTLADRAYFLEKGEVRFDGQTADLIQRDDIVRSVFLEGATTAAPASNGHRPARPHARSMGSASPPADAGAPASRSPRLEFVSVSKSFGGITAVNDASLTLFENEILGLIGPNGAGKTTIFDLISGFLAPDDGHISLGGVDITRLAPDRRAWMQLGRSFQDARLSPALTVAENLAIGFERHLPVRDHFASLIRLPGVVALERSVSWSVHDLIELMGLGAYRDKFVRELSTGTRRIVDLAMCLAHEPTVLLLDEPSSGIAQRESEALGPLLHRVQAETRCSLLIIEHDIPLVSSIADRMIALDQGHPIAEGTPAEVIQDPLVVASYLGGDPATIYRSGRAPGDPSPTSPGARPPSRQRPLVARSENGGGM